MRFTQGSLLGRASVCKIVLLVAASALAIEPAAAQDNFFPPGSVITPDGGVERDRTQPGVPAIELGPEGEFDVPSALGLMLYSNTVSQILKTPELRALWVKDFGLNENIEAKLSEVLGDFLARYDALENARVARACLTFNDSANAARGNAEALAYEELYGPLRTAEAQALYEQTMGRLESEVSPEIAAFIQKAVTNKVERASLKMMDYETYNAQQGISAEAFFAGKCN